MVPSSLFEPYLAFLSRLPLFQGQSRQLMTDILSKARLRELRRGELLFAKGDPSDWIYCVVTGRLKLFFSSEQGQEKVLEVIGPGETFGEVAVFQRKPYPVFAGALGAATVIAIPREQLYQAMDRDPEAAFRVIANLSKRLYNLIGEMENFCVHNARERVVGYLVCQVKEQERWDGGEVSIRLPATKSTTASLLNLTPETFSRVLHQLEHDEVIAVDGKTIRVLDVEQLFDRAPC